jgi:hypothetical protein
VVLSTGVKFGLSAGSKSSSGLRVPSGRVATPES